MGHCPKGILVPMCFLCSISKASRMVWLKIRSAWLEIAKNHSWHPDRARRGGVGDARSIAEQHLVEKLFKASFNKQPKVSAAGHPCSQHPPPPPAVHFLPLKRPAAPTSSRAIGSSCAASQRSRDAGAGRRLRSSSVGTCGTRAAELWVSPFVFEQGKVKLRQVAVAGESRAPSFCTSSDVLSAKGRNKGFFFTLKQAGMVLWEGVLALFDNPFSCFLGCRMRKGRSGSSYSFSGMFFFPGIILAYKMK